MGKKTMTSVASLFLLCFYVGIVLYTFFAVCKIHTIPNFLAALVFESIGILFLIIFVIGNIVIRRIKVGYLAPLAIVTIVYILIIDLLNLVFAVFMPMVLFVLINLIVLFVYCFVSAPMYIMGKNN